MALMPKYAFGKSTAVDVPWHEAPEWLSEALAGFIVEAPAWVGDESTWQRAKEAVDPGECDDYYACVTDVYKNMGGEVKKKGNSDDVRFREKPWWKRWPAEIAEDVVGMPPGSFSGPEAVYEGESGYEEIRRRELEEQGYTPEEIDEHLRSRRTSSRTLSGRNFPAWISKVDGAKFAGPVWVADEAIWERAKRATKKYKDTARDYYAVVSEVYFNMGGEKK